MDQHRPKTSKRLSASPSRGSYPSNDSLPNSRSDDILSKSDPAVPQREPRSARGDPLLPFVALVKTFNEFLFELDADGKFLSIWTSNEALLRERRAEFLGRRALEVLGEEIFHPFSELFRRVIKQDACEDIEFPVDFPTGRRWFHARVSAVGRGARKSHSVCLLARYHPAPALRGGPPSTRGASKACRASHRHGLLRIRRSHRQAHLVAPTFPHLRFQSQGRRSQPRSQVRHDSSRTTASDFAATFYRQFSLALRSNPKPATI